VTKVLSKEEVKRAIERSGKDFGKSTQRTTMKRSFHWRVFFIKYVITVVVSDEVVKAWLDV
jgi:hypothetical protein